MIIDELYDFGHIKPFSTQLTFAQELAVRAASGFTGEMCMGILPQVEDLHFMATLDLDGHIELSLSFQDRRPTDVHVDKAFKLFSIANFAGERSKAVGVIRHFIIRQGSGLMRSPL